MKHQTKSVNYSYPGGVVRWPDMTKTIALLVATLLLAPSTIISAHPPTITPKDPYNIAGKAHRLGLDHRLVYAIIKVESNWKETAKGDSGRSNGLMQVQCPTARAIHPLKKCSDLLKADVNLNYGMSYLKQQIDLYGKKDIRRAISAYNAGRPILRGKKFINQKYVSDVMRHYAEYSKEEISI